MKPGVNKGDSKLHAMHTLLGFRSRGAGITTAASAMNGATRSSLNSVMPAASAASSIPAAGKTTFPFTCRMQTEIFRYQLYHLWVHEEENTKCDG